MILFLLIASVVSAQTTNPFERISEPLGNLFDSVAKMLSLTFIQEDYQLEAVFRLFLFIIIFTVLHGILKKAFGRTSTDKILEDKAINVLAVVVALAVAIFTPIEYLFRGAALLISLAVAGALVWFYWTFKIGKTVMKDLTKGQAAAARTGVLFTFLIILLVFIHPWMADFDSTKIGRLTPNATEIERVFMDVLAWIETATIIIMIVNLVSWLLLGGHDISSVPTSVPEKGIGGGPRGFLAQYFPTVVLSKSERALKTIQDLKRNLLVWNEAIEEDKVKLLKKQNAYGTFIAGIDTLRSYDQDVLKRRIENPTQAVKNILNEVQEEENLLIALLNLPVSEMLRQLPETTIGISKDERKEARQEINKAIKLLDALAKLNQQEQQQATQPQT